ncbi:replicative DNA helicase [Natronobacillus azotifigens]|uniref:Replicative DNA helicase n=1 Tax=Natronobacillus azotifigens TaxID=472978 RepID=A0A9J6R7I0_9BACI|nr:replicative DNA helicase [Natronobacillus azotifigens]MCZ0701594.1 replicative DNA helicase [Natronobacillus azotifigens]
MEGYRLDELDFREITNGYKERVRRLALFDPLYDLDRKREQDQLGNPIDMKGLGLLALLFFFEQKLMRDYKTDRKQLTLFLQRLTKNHYQLEETDYEKIARTIIQTFRPSTGKKSSYSFFNWESGVEESIEYSILKANNFDSKTNTQYYTLDDDGLELIFATKEFYSEFQLSINQLMLRKQLDKGEFNGALRQINEMRIDVESLEERMTKLKHEIQRSIVSEETFERYKQLLDDIYGRLQREDEEFKELRQFVKETRERLYSKDLHKKESKTYNVILRITRELESVHYEHSHLLEKTFALKNTTLVTAQESLYYTGIQAFNFDQDIVSHVVSTPLPYDSMPGILAPFLKVEENPIWSPLTLLAEQNITEEREQRVEQGFIEAKDHEKDDPYRDWIMTKYKQLMEQFLHAYDSGKGSTLSQFMTYLDEVEASDRFEQRYFYDFWLILHQRSPIHRDVSEEQDNQTLLGEALSLLGKRTLIVEEGNGIVQRTERFSIQELSISLEEPDDELF